MKLPALNTQNSISVLFDPGEACKPVRLHRFWGQLRFRHGTYQTDENHGRNDNNRPTSEHHAISLRTKFNRLANVHQHERNVISRRSLPPSSDGVKNGLFHFLGRQERNLSDDFPDAGDAEHLSPRIENFGDPVCV